MPSTLLSSLHRRLIHEGRVERLANSLTQFIDENVCSLLDVGCGDGRLARTLASAKPGLDVKGVDVLVRPTACIPVVEFDGASLPFPNATFDTAILVDVLHHTESPGLLLAETARVVKPSGSIILKDHVSWGRLSQGVLWAMDIAGNLPNGIAVPANYLSFERWVSLFAEAKLSPERLLWPFDVHPALIRLVARSEYQFVAALRKIGDPESTPNGRRT